MMRFKEKLASWLYGGVLALVLVGCSSNDQSALKELRVLAVENPQINITAETPLTWYSEFEILAAKDHKQRIADDLPDFERLLKQQIEHTIIAKGFNFNTEQKQADTQYQVVAIATTGDASASAEYLELFQLFPELTYDTDLTQGTLIVAIVDPKQKKAAWRGSIQLFLEPDLDKQVRLERVSHSVEKLLQTLTPLEQESL